MSGVFTGQKFLVVDDEPDLREILKDELEFEGASVMEAENGKKALEIVKANQFSAVISDIRMPGGDGVTLAREIKAIHAEKPAVILITGFADISSDEAYDLGVEGFITKPFNLGPIRENIQRVLMPRKERWARELSLENIKTLSAFGNFQKLMENKKANIARGGFFIEGDFFNYRVGEIVQFDFQDFKGFGQVCWVRSEANEDLPKGAGIEILKLNLEYIDQYDQLIEQRKPKSFLPRK